MLRGDEAGSPTKYRSCADETVGIKGRRYGPSLTVLVTLVSGRWVPEKFELGVILRR
jgi:hypothetical protein